MRLVNILLVFSLFLFCSFTSTAQLTMFEGKIRGEDGLPLKGAIIQLKWKGDMIETRSDDEGMFYTTRIPTGMYKIGVEADGKYYKMHGLKVLPSEAKKMYMISIHGGRLFVDVEGMDAYLKSELSNISNRDPRYDCYCNDFRIAHIPIDSKKITSFKRRSDCPSNKVVFVPVR